MMHFNYVGSADSQSRDRVHSELKKGDEWMRHSSKLY